MWRHITAGESNIVAVGSASNNATAGRFDARFVQDSAPI